MSSNLTKAKKISAMLRKIANGGEPPSIKYGLCEHINNLMFKKCRFSEHAYLLQDQITKIIKSWPRNSGRKSFPVPSCNANRSPDEAYRLHRNNLRMYKGPYGALRRDLARHIADCLDGCIARGYL